MKNNNIFCFASKRINLIYDKTSWRPDIWAASDLDYVETYLDEIKEMKGCTKLLCAQVITRQMGIVDDAVIYHLSKWKEDHRGLMRILCLGYISGERSHAN